METVPVLLRNILAELKTLNENLAALNRPGPETGDVKEAPADGAD